jgi:hypothetical protein
MGFAKVAWSVLLDMQPVHFDGDLSSFVATSQDTFILSGRTDGFWKSSKI